MTMKISYLGLAAVALAAAAPAGAQMVRAQDPKSVAAAMQEAGYAAKLDKDKTGDPMITSGSSGSEFRVLFYNCTKNRDCATVQFQSGYTLEAKLPLTKINDWNSSQRFGRAYLDKESDPVIEMDLDLDDGGLSKALFTDNLEFWVSVLTAFEKHIGYRD
jgi:hypothetical protein